MKEALPSFASEYWTYLGQWHQPTICNGFWCYWHTTSAVQQLLPDIRFHTLLDPDGHFWIAKEDVASLHALFDSLDKERTDVLIEHLHTIGEEAVKNHLGVLENRQRHYAKYLLDLFSTYKEISGVWTLAWLSDELGTYMVKKGMYTEEELLDIVSRNVRPTWLIEEYQSIKNIGKVLTERHGSIHPDAVTESFLGENSEIRDLIEAHVRKYEWFGTHHWMGEAYTIEKCLVEVRECLRKKDDEIGTGGASPQEWHFLTTLLLEFAYWRTHAAEVTVKVVFLSREKMEECARDLSLSYDDLIFLSDEEILESIQQKESVVSREKIEERKVGQGCYLKEGKLEVVSGENLRQMLEVLKHNIAEVDSDVREFGGTVACRGGIVTGRVSILISPSDFKNFQPGNILVVPETTPDFVPFMQSALAIITERGGITSHAAIVARELKKPCIIGTKIATQILHDGDMIEMDTEKGIIKILNKA